MAGSLSVRKRNAANAMMAKRRRANEAATANAGKLGSGIASIPKRVVNYIKSSTPSSVGRDVKGIAKATYEAATEDPNAFIEDAIFSPLAAIRDFGDVRETARKLRAQGRDAEAEKMEAMAGTAVLSAVPILGRPAGVATRKAIKAAEKSAIKGATKAAEMAVTPKAKPPSLLSAVRVGGKTYTGPTHLDALDAIPDPKVRSQASLDANSRGFVNERGKYMDRFKAADYARNFDLFSPDAPDWAKTAPEVISENLRLPELAVKAETPKVAPVVKSIATPPEPTGIIAYHGSPHSFDRFDISKIGTGEGNQAYGRGLYFAENEDVAKSYRDDVTAQQARMRGGWSPTKPSFITSKGEIAEGHPDYLAAKFVSDANGFGVGNDWIKEQINLLGLNQYGRGKDIMQRVRRLQKGDIAENQTDGAMYQVRINSNPEDFLDWDQPLREQPKALQVLRDVDLSGLKEGNRTRVMLEYAMQGREQDHNLAKGRDLMMGLDTTPGNNFSANTSEFLKAQGFPGVRYLDQGSRGIDEGSRNYVVLDDALIKLLRKYAMGGSVAA